LPVRLDGGRLHGRGACDAKGALAAALVAAHRHDGPGEIVVVGAVGEERDSRGTRHLLPRTRPDFLIVGEPSGWDGVTIGYKGNLSLVLRLDGERAHLSTPAATTVETGLTFIERLRGFCDAHAGPTPFHSLTMKTRSINTTQEGSAEHVEIGLNLRLPPGDARPPRTGPGIRISTTRTGRTWTSASCDAPSRSCERRSRSSRSRIGSAYAWPPLNRMRLGGEDHLPEVERLRRREQQIETFQGLREADAVHLVGPL